jgi:hypothetical protein
MPQSPELAHSQTPSRSQHTSLTPDEDDSTPQSPEPAHDSHARSKSQHTSRTVDEDNSAPQPPDHNQNTGTGEDQIKCQDLWKRAFDILQEREPHLVTDYKKHLAPGDNNTDPLETVQSTTSVVKQLSEDREKKQWRFSFQGKDVKFREVAEKLIKILIWSDGVVKPALSAQPYAALAWSGISILLPVC